MVFPVAAIPGIASAVGGIAGLFHKNKNPADVANKTIGQIPGSVNPYYQPYIDSGKGALGKLQGEYGKMINNTGDLYNQLGSGYKESPGYQFRLQQAMNAGNNASAAGGMAGSSQHEQQNMQVAGDMADADFEKYMNHVMGLYGQGIEGEKGLNTQGYDASSSYGNLVGSVLGQQGQNAYAGQAGENASNAKNWSNIFSSSGGQALANYLGGI